MKEAVINRILDNNIPLDSSTRLNASMSEIAQTDSVAPSLIWPTFAKAIGAELRPGNLIRGLSGLDHEVEAIAVDEPGKRIIIVSAEASPRTAALMQVDVQASMPDTRIIVARPIAIDLVEIVRRIAVPLRISEIDIPEAQAWVSNVQARKAENQVTELGPEVENVLKEVLGNIGSFSMPTIPQLISLITQAEKLPWAEITKIFDKTAATGTLDLKPLIATDNLAADLAAGVCPIPLYELAGKDIELFASGRHTNEARQKLKDMGIYQYFFPSPDILALGLVDQGVSSGNDVVTLTSAAPTLGHPFGPSEIVKSTTNLMETVEQLKDIGYIVEGEQGIEISESGKVVRQTLKFRPREGLLTKLINRISLSASVSPGDFIK